MPKHLRYLVDKTTVALREIAQDVGIKAWGTKSQIAQRIFDNVRWLPPSGPCPSGINQMLTTHCLFSPQDPERARKPSSTAATGDAGASGEEEPQAGSSGSGDAAASASS